MTTPGSGTRQFRLGFVMIAPIAVVTALVTFLPPDGNDRAEWVQFIGHFHPLVVHFPIALFLLVPILELAGLSERLSYLRLSVEFVVALATLAATTAAILGWCLGRSGGYSGSLIRQHMWGGILLCIVCWLCWWLRARMPERGAAYAALLALGVGTVAWTGYRGGQLSLGANHLTEHMPEDLRSLLGVESGGPPPLPADPNTFYGARVQPIFAARCVSCHSADKHKGNLRLDDYRGLLHGGKHGAVVVAGNAQGSELFRRITLPASNDDFMPRGKPPLSAEQLKVIEAWIGAGASDKLAADAIKNAPSGSTATPVAEVAIEEIDPAAVAKLRSAAAPTVAQLQKQFPNILDYDSRGSADLRLDASSLGGKFGDKELEAFSTVAEQITFADLSRTAVTDHSAAVIAGMKRLRVLRLANTSITDATLLHLGSMSQLQSLNVYGTSVTPAVLPAITKLPKLSHFYVGQTAIPPGKSVPEDVAAKLVF